MRKLTTLRRRISISSSLLIITSCGSNLQTENDRQVRGVEENVSVEKSFSLKEGRTVVKGQAAASDAVTQKLTENFTNQAPNHIRDHFEYKCSIDNTLNSNGKKLAKALRSKALIEAATKIFKENDNCSAKSAKILNQDFFIDPDWFELKSDYSPSGIVSTMIDDNYPQSGYIEGICQLYYYVTVDVSFECDAPSTEDENGTKVSSAVAPTSNISSNFTTSVSDITVGSTSKGTSTNEIENLSEEEMRELIADLEAIASGQQSNSNSYISVAESKSSGEGSTEAMPELNDSSAYMDYSSSNNVTAENESYSTDGFTTNYDMTYSDDYVTSYDDYSMYGY